VPSSLFLFLPLVQGQWLWAKEPVNLFLHNIIKSRPLAAIIFGWELPENLLQALAKDRISKFEDVHGHQENIHEVKGKRHHLLRV
jgi:hypothetical protein